MLRKEVCAGILAGICLATVCASRIEFYECSELNADILYNRSGILVEHIVGEVTSPRKEGRIINYADADYDYISYTNVPNAEAGDWIDTYCVYNPLTNGEDDILLRIDFIR